MVTRVHTSRSHIRNERTRGPASQNMDMVCLAAGPLAKSGPQLKQPVVASQRRMRLAMRVQESVWEKVLQPQSVHEPIWAKH